MTFLSQSTAKIYVSFHTHGLCFWLNCARSPVLDSLLAASLTFATTSWEVALSCATTRLVSEKANRDRKSVVQGKSVDLGGRRIIKKKKNKRPDEAGYSRR